MTPEAAINRHLQDQGEAWAADCRLEEARQRLDLMNRLHHYANPHLYPHPTHPQEVMSP